MKYRTLGKTGLKVSVVGLGTWQFGGQWGKQFEQAEVDRIIAAAGEHGVNFIDTAECYGANHLSETMIGKAIKGQRSRWVVATKFGHKPGGLEPKEVYYSAAEVEKQLAESLHALQTDYIDVYQFHSGDNACFDDEELWQMLHRQVARGKIRHLGISIGDNTNMHQTRGAQSTHCATLQLIYNRLNQRADTEVLAEAQRQNLGVIVRTPLASGFLSGKYQAGSRWPEGDVRHPRNPDVIDRELTEALNIAADECPQEVPMAAWAIAWALRHPAISCAIPGCKSVEQLEINCLAAEQQALVSSSHPMAWESAGLFSQLSSVLKRLFS